jgi:adenosine deaminase
MDQTIKTWIHEIPKVELHIHLEGAFSIETLWQLIQKYNGVKEVGSIEKLIDRFQFRNFDHFIDNWMWKDGFIREYEDFTLIASDAAKRLAQCNVRYAEFHFTPAGFLDNGLSVGRVVEAIRKGFDEHTDAIKLNLIADLCRDTGPKAGEAVLERLRELKDDFGVIGIGLGGPETNFPPEPYEPVFEKARQFGFRTTAHAGEAAGPRSVWGALHACKAERIGHATRAIEDADLVEFLRINRIPLELCPISNYKLKIVPKIENHPVRRYFDAGMCVFVNTDDPMFFQNTMDDEYALLVGSFGFTRNELLVLTRNAAKAAWCDEAVKNEFEMKLLNFIDTHGEEQ